MIYLIPREARPFLRNFALAGALACMTQQALAANTDGLFAARGIGAVACESIVDTEGEERAAITTTLSSWVAGYISHANRVTSDRFEVTPVVDNTVLAAMVIQFCAANRDALVESVFASVLESTAKGGQATESALTELRNGDSVIVLRSAAVSNVQQALADQDLLAQSDVDGAYGPRTRDALSTFQQQRELTQTGLPDALTLLALFAPSPQ